MSNSDKTVDWSKTTFEGGRREQLRRWAAMSLRERLEALDRLSEQASQLAAKASSAATLSGVQEERPGYRRAKGGNEIVLSGCAPIPLAAYLKALAVLRLVAEQAGDPGVTGCWRNDAFVLQTRLTREELIEYFLRRYEPTPIISPWSGRAGFLEGDAGNESDRKGAKAVRQIIQSKGNRFAAYRDVFARLANLPAIGDLNRVRSEIKQLESTKKQRKPINENLLKALKERQKQIKDALLPALRAQLPEKSLGWLDACFVLADKVIPAPLFGTGGNEGSMDFSVNHVLTLMSLIGVDSDEPSPHSKGLLEQALFGLPTALSDLANLGFLNPAAAGGANMTSGFEGAPNDNPWNSVLAIEGALFLAATAVRRLGISADAALSAPFFFESIRDAHGAGVVDEKVRPEFWAPLWSTPASFDDVQYLFTEGRVVVGRRPSRTALDIVQAIKSFGVDRGISEFQRYTFAERRGKGYFVATPLQRITAVRDRHVDLIANLDAQGWLRRVQNLANNDAPAALRVLVFKLNAALFTLCQKGSSDIVQRLLRIMGRIEYQYGLSAGQSQDEKKRNVLCPLPSLSIAWAAAADDGSADFRIALALAGLSMRAQNGGKPVTIGLRHHLAPMSRSGRDWDPESHLVCWGPGSIERNLAALLQRRRIEAVRIGAEGETLHSQTGASLEDVCRFLSGETDDRRIAELMHGLACVNLDGWRSSLDSQTTAPPAAYSLLKPFFTAESQLKAIGWLSPDRTLRLPAELPARLAADDVNAALRIAWQRLRAIGCKLPGRNPPQAPRGSDGPRLLAALMIPLAFSETRRLLRWLNVDPENETAGATELSANTAD